MYSILSNVLGIPRLSIKIRFRYSLEREWLAPTVLRPGFESQPHLLRFFQFVPIIEIDIGIRKVRK